MSGEQKCSDTVRATTWQTAAWGALPALMCVETQAVASDRTWLKDRGASAKARRVRSSLVRQHWAHLVQEFERKEQVRRRGMRSTEVHSW